MGVIKSVMLFAAIIIAVELLLLIPFLFLSGSESSMQVVLVVIFSAFVALTALIAIVVWRRRFARLKEQR